MRGAPSFGTSVVEKFVLWLGREIGIHTHFLILYLVDGKFCGFLSDGQNFIFLWRGGELLAGGWGAWEFLPILFHRPYK